MLRDPARAVLGAAEKPIGLTGAAVQWNPDDTRLVAAEIVLEDADEGAWEVSGRVFRWRARVGGRQSELARSAKSNHLLRLS